MKDTEKCAFAGRFGDGGGPGFYRIPIIFLICIYFMRLGIFAAALLPAFPEPRCCYNMGLVMAAVGIAYLLAS